jgi:hypothetical protein
MLTEKIDGNEIAPGVYQPLIQPKTEITRAPVKYLLFKVTAPLFLGDASCIQSHSNDALANDKNIQRL